MENGSLAGLPQAYFIMVPELKQLRPPAETRATCSSCVMTAPPGVPRDPERHFEPVARCCTYQPTVPSYSLGRSLSRGGIGATMIRKRMQSGLGVSAYNVHPSKEWFAEYRSKRDEKFGRHAAWRCPLHVDGDLGCSIWEDRNATCRTWFCKLDDGIHGLKLWSGVRELLKQLERTLTRWLVDIGDPPEEGEAVEVFEAWYMWCADRLDAATPDELRALRSDETEEHVARMLEYQASLHPAVPEVLAPAVSGVEPYKGGFRLTGYTPFDPVEVPKGIFELLSRLDGERGWREVLDEVGPERLDTAHGEELVKNLFVAGILEQPKDYHVRSGQSAELGGVYVRDSVWRRIEPDD